MPEKATSLEELEASLRQMTGLGVDARPQERQVSALAEDNSSTDELSAFKKFVSSYGLTVIKRSVHSLELSVFPHLSCKDCAALASILNLMHDRITNFLF